VPTRKPSDQLSLFFASADPPEPEPDIDGRHPHAITPSAKQAFTNGDGATHPVATTVVVAPTEALSALTADSPGREIDEPEECEWSSFMRRHGRIPTIDDAKKPWEYRGWLLYYRMVLEEHPTVGRRWDYWFRTMMSGRLLPEPIPKLEIAPHPDRTVFRAIEDWVRLIDRHCSGGSAVEKLLEWFLWSFGHSKRTPGFCEELNESLYRQVNIGPMLVTPYDYIGEWIAMQKSGWNPNAFYPTPHSVVDCMVRMTMESDEDARGKKVMDPCVGSGRMLIHASNYSLRLYGIDIDPAMVKLTCMNGALYVPWILRPFPDRFFVASESTSQAVTA